MTVPSASDSQTASDECAIEVSHLVKEFTIYHEGYASLKSRVMAMADPRRWRQTGRRGGGVERRRVLDDLSFRIGHGETVGLIGRNGSGKSTLLSLLSRIYRPTAGCVTVRGRVVPLLELGAGFNPELSGVENIFFNATILGLPLRAIRQRFDDIVAFAELEKSIDMPIRNYSSGMLVRLGFSIAVHVDADVLLVDEALAVGDAAFQAKCLARIADYQRAGKTIVLVSHSENQIRRVCTRALWLKHGKIVRDGDVSAVLEDYARDIHEP